MRAVVLRNMELVVDDIDQPEPAEGEALVKSLACGICGSDLHFVKFGQEMVTASQSEGRSRFAPDLERDIVMGHEFCCEVVAYGPNTPETVPVGERCVSVPSRGAYSNEYPGGYSEYMVLDASMLLPVADSLATHHAAVTEPMAVGLHAVRAGAFSDEPAVIYGCGPVGLATIAGGADRGGRFFAEAPGVGGDDGGGQRGGSARVVAGDGAGAAGIVLGDGAVRRSRGAGDAVAAVARGA